jgi:hypothetical protein
VFGYGVPSWPQPSTEWDWWPFLGIALALVVVRHSLRLPLGVPVLLISVAIGPFFSLAVHAIGVVGSIASVVALAAVLSWGRGRSRGDSPPVV